MQISERLKNAVKAFRNDGGACTLAAPSGDFIQSLCGFPTASGKPVTKDTAIRVGAFLSAVKVLSNDLAKMPLVLRETKMVDGRKRTQPAIDNPLYPLLAYAPNAFHTSYQCRWFLAAALIMNGNSYCQILKDGKGDIAGLNPLSSWEMTQKWDKTDPKNPKLYWEYGSEKRRFEQHEIWHVTNSNLDLNGICGVSIVALAKEALSILAAAEEVAGRNFANGLGMTGFITAPPGAEITETEAQNVVDRLRKDFSGSQNAGKFTLLPGDLKWVSMANNAKDSQLLESRKWNAEEVVRTLGGAPLLVKLGYGDKNSTYASSSAFLEDYWQTALMPHAVSIEQSITRDLIPKKDQGSIYAKHDANIILRGSLRERAETYEIQLRSGQLSPNEVLALEDQDSIDGFGDFRFFPANSAYFDPASGLAAIPGQNAPAPNPTEASKPADAAAELGDRDQLSNRLQKIAVSMASRVLRKEKKSGAPDGKFVSEVLNVSIEAAEKYVAARKDMDDEQAKTALINLVVKE